MNGKDNLPILDSKVVAERLIQAIETDEKIVTSNSLNFAALKDHLPAMCELIVRAMVDDTTNLVNQSEENYALQHSFSRSAQDFEPAESDLFLRQQRQSNSDAAISNLEHIRQVLQQGRNVLRLTIYCT